MKKYFITGLVILLPIALTFMVIVFLFNFFTKPFIPIVSHLMSHFETEYHFALPPRLSHFLAQLIALLLLFLVILCLGVLARWFVLKSLFALGNKILSRIPLIKTVYKVSRDIFSSLFSVEGKKAFKYPVFFPFPHPGTLSLGFQAGEVAEECQKKIEEPLTSIFMPTAPHPISGFLLLVPTKDVQKIPMDNEQAVKFLVSCGMVEPHEP